MKKNQPHSFVFWKMLVFLPGIFLFIFLMIPGGGVFAAEATPQKDDGCISCHESLYYLHDTGKYFCLCAEQMTCTCCHGGNSQSLDEEEAHAGMVLYPTTHEADKCQQCHQEDYKAKVERFSEIAGINEFHQTNLTLPSAPLSEEVLSQADLGNGVVSRLLEPWRLAGIVLAALGLVAIAILAYRCWKADCMAKLQGR